MNKFAKLIESPSGEQFLLSLEQNEDNEKKCNIITRFKCEGADVKLTIGGVNRKNAEKYLKDYSELDALVILDDPLAYIQSLTQ